MFNKNSIGGKIKITGFIKQFIVFTFLFYSKKITAQNVEEFGKSKPIKVFGSVGLGAWVYNHSGATKQYRRAPYSWYITGAPTLQIYSFTFPFSLTISEQQRDFSQPFNQYGCSPYYKWFTAHLGYSNMQFSQYTLAGQSFLGAGVELQPKYFRLGTFYGRFRKAVNPDTNSTNYSLPNVFAAYKRMAFGAKLGFGNKANFVDLIFLKGWDDENSIVLRNQEKMGILPGENICIGIKSNFNPAKNLIIDIDAATSALTIDKRRVDSIAEIKKEIPIIFHNLMTLNYSTHIYGAFQASATYRYKKFSIRGMYKYVEPDFQSFGSNYIQGDLIDITLSPSMSIAKGKLNLNTTFGQRKDNLQNYKNATTTRNLLNANLQWNPNQKFGFGCNYGNFGTAQTNGRILLNDSIKVSNVNQSAGVNFRIQKFANSKSSILLWMINYNDFSDRNEVTRQFTQSNTIISNISYVVNNNKKNIGYSFSLAGNKVSVRRTEIVAVGPNIGFNKSLKNQRLKININSGYQLRIQNKKNDGGVLNVNADLGYAPNKHHNFNVGIFIINNTSSNNSSYTFGEQRLIIRYSYNF